MSVANIKPSETISVNMGYQEEMPFDRFVSLNCFIIYYSTLFNSGHKFFFIYSGDVTTEAFDNVAKDSN